MISWLLEQQNEPLVRRDRNPGPLRSGWSRIHVAGCGLCHTDLGFMFTDVVTRAPLPITLGHEISGTVLEGPGAGEPVIIPAVIPCRTCEPCRAGQPRICRNQVMPGNDIHGGFAEIVDVPGHDLVILPEWSNRENLARYSVIADAVTTPLQAIHNLALDEGEVAVIIGCGGVGGFAALIAHAIGAHVIAMDIDDTRLEKLEKIGIPHTINVKEKDGRSLKKWLRELCKSAHYPNFGHKIFETSGSAAGQELAFQLLGYGAKLAVVGFTMAKLELRLSNLMAFDAQLVGNWGASPEIYPEAIHYAAKGALHLEEFTELVPLSDINEIVTLAREHKLEKRAIFVP